MRDTIDPRVPSALPVPSVSSFGELARRLAVTGFLLAALTVLASIALAAQP
jgi:hypothetical protein